MTPIEPILRELKDALGELRAEVASLEAQVAAAEGSHPEAPALAAEAVRRWMTLDFTKADDLVGELTVALADAREPERRLQLVKPLPDDEPAVARG